MPWSINGTGRFSGLWNFLQTAGRRSRSVCRTEACGNVPSDSAHKQEHQEPRLLGRKEHLAHSQPARSRTEPSVATSARARRASRGRSRSPDVETSEDCNIEIPRQPHIGETFGDDIMRDTRSLFQRFCQKQLRWHISVTSGGGLEEVQATSGSSSGFLLRVRRRMRLAELFPACFSLTLAGEMTTVGPGVVMFEAEPKLQISRQTLQKFECCNNEENSLPIAAVLLTSFDKARGLDIDAAQQIYSDLVVDLHSSIPSVPLVLACMHFDERACAEREASLSGRHPSERALSCESTEGRGRTLSRGTRSRRDHAPTRRARSREACNSGGELVEAKFTCI